MMAMAYCPIEIDPAQLAALTDPVRTQLRGILRGTHESLDRYRLLAILRWLDLLKTKPVEDWPDIHRVGREASKVIAEMVDSLDRRIHSIEDTIALGFLDWSLIRRHMLLQSRRTRLVQLGVDLEDMVHALMNLY